MYIILEIVESIPIVCQTVIMKPTQNKRTLNKGPFLANIPLQHMVQNYNADIKDTSHVHVSPRKQVCPYI